MPRTRRLGFAAAAVVPLVAALSGCSVVAAFTPHVEPAIYDTAKDFRAANTASVGSPKFLPDDATIIRVDRDSQTGEAIMTYTSPTHLKADACTPVKSAPPKPTIQDSWWPTSPIPEKAWSSCGGGWSAFYIGSQVYAARLPVK